MRDVHGPHEGLVVGAKLARVTSDPREGGFGRRADHLLNTDVLIVDEVLAVGDAEFQKKCLGKMREVSKGGRTVVFVSHNMAAVQALCSRVIWLNRGSVAGVGDVREGTAKYLANDQRALAPRVGSSARLGEGLELLRFEVTPNPAETAANVSFSLEIQARRPTKVSELAILIYSSLEARVAIVDCRSTRFPLTLSTEQSWTISGSIRALPLVEGDYRLGLYVGTSEFFGDVPDLVELSVGPRALVGAPAPYAAAYRGVVELECAFH